MDDNKISCLKVCPLEGKRCVFRILPKRKVYSVTITPEEAPKKVSPPKEVKKENPTETPIKIKPSTSSNLVSSRSRYKTVPNYTPK